MKFWKSLLLFTVTTLFAQSAMAHNTQGRKARAEFLVMKEAGEWQSFLEYKTYAIVGDTDFIALELAQNELRSCVFGFRQSEVSSETHTAKTRFLCFDTGEYLLHMYAELCAGCEMRNPDPAAISVGIGNIRVVEPTLGLFPNKTLNTVLNTYPGHVGVNIVEPKTPRTPKTLDQKLEDILNGKN